MGLINDFATIYQSFALAADLQKKVSALADTISYDKTVEIHVCWEPGPPPSNLSVDLGHSWLYDTNKFTCVDRYLRGAKGRPNIYDWLHFETKIINVPLSHK